MLKGNPRCPSLCCCLRFLVRSELQDPQPPLEAFKRAITKESLFDDVYTAHCHMGGHRGVTATFNQMKQMHGSRGFSRAHVEMFVRTCEICVTAAPVVKKPVPGGTPILVSGFMTRVQMDCVDMQAFARGDTTATKALVDGAPESMQKDLREAYDRHLKALENAPANSNRIRVVPKYLLTMQCCASKVADFFAIESKRPEATAYCALEFFTRFGFPGTIHTDNGMPHLVSSCLISCRKPTCPCPNADLHHGNATHCHPIYASVYAP